jgi:hypothetical protein
MILTRLGAALALGAALLSVPSHANPLGLTPGVAANVTTGTITGLSQFNTATGASDISYNNSDLATRTYTVRLPSGYNASDPAKKYGLITYIDAGTPHNFPSSYAAACDARDIIWIGGHGIENAVDVNTRRGVAIMGAYRMTQLYPIDPARIYVSGLSGGGRTGNDLAWLRSDYFRGFIGRVGSSMPAQIPGFQTAGSNSNVGNYDADYEWMLVNSTVPPLGLPAYFRTALMTQYGDFRRSEQLAIYRYGHLNHGNFARAIVRSGGHSDEIGASFTDAIDFLYHPANDVVWDRFEDGAPASNYLPGKPSAGHGFTFLSGTVSETTTVFNSGTHGVLRLNGHGAAARSNDVFTWKTAAGAIIDARLRAETVSGSNQKIGLHIVPATASGTAANLPGFHLYWCYGQPYRAELVGTDGTVRTLATWEFAATHPMSLATTVTSPQAGEGTVPEKTFWNAFAAPDAAGRVLAFRPEEVRAVLNSVGFQLTFNRPVTNFQTTYSGVAAATTDGVTTDPNENFPILVQGFWNAVETAVVNALPAGTYRVVLTNNAVNTGLPAGNALVDELRVIAAEGPATAPGIAKVVSGTTRVDVGWAGVASATAYVIQRATSAGGTFASVATVPGHATLYSDTTANQTQPSFYRVAAIGPDGLTGDPSGVGIGVANAGFELPALGSGSSYNPSGATWSFQAKSGNSGSGIAANGSSIARYNGLVPEGTQVAFLQGGGTFGQTISGFVAGGTYRVTFKAAQRKLSTGSIENQSWNVRLDASSPFATFAPGNGSGSEAYGDYSGLFAATGPSHVLKFTGLSSSAIALIDAVRVEAVAPAPPTALSGSSPADYQYALAWADAANNETGYRVERRVTGTSAWTVLSGTLPAGATAYLDTTVGAGVTYDYRVGATGFGGTAYTFLQVTTPGIKPPTPPNLTVTPGFTTNALAWGTSAGAASYTVKRATSPGGPYAVIATSLTGTAYTDTQLVTGTPYYYIVVAVSGALESDPPSAVSGSPVPGTAVKANNTTALDQGASWNTGVVPTPLDAARWDGAYTSGSASVGGGVSVDRIEVVAPSTAITVGEGTGAMALAALTGTGIDLGAATQNLTVQCPVTLGASQAWRVAAGRTLSVTGAVGQSAAGSGLALSGSGGAFVFAGQNAYTGTTAIQAGAALNHQGALAGAVVVGLSSSAGSANFTNSGTVAGPVTVAAGSGSVPGFNNTVITGNALFNDGSSVAAATGITNDGQLTLGGSGALVLGTIGSVASGTQGTGAIIFNNTRSSGNSLVFAPNTSLSAYKLGPGAVGTATTSGTVYIRDYGYSDNRGFTHTFSGGTWYLGRLGQNNTGAQTGGTTIISGGAQVFAGSQAWASVSSASSYLHGIYVVGGTSPGWLEFNQAISELNGRTTAPTLGGINGLQFTVGEGGTLRSTGGSVTLATTAAQAQPTTNSLTVQAGGTAAFSGGFFYIGNQNVAQTQLESNVVDVQGGTFTQSNWTLQLGPSGTSARQQANRFFVSAGSAVIGAAGSLQNLNIGSPSNVADVSNTVALSGGKLVVAGAISAGNGAGQSNSFLWTGGQLSAGTLTAGTSFTGTSSLGASGLAQTAGVLAPGDLATAGRTTVNGNYTLGLAGSLALEIGGTTQATSFQSGQYDYVNVTGTAALSGTLSVALAGGFTPTSGQSFTVLNAAALSGSFANVAFGGRIATPDGKGSFLVTRPGNTVLLSQFLTPVELWRLTYFGSSANAGSGADGADFDGDGEPNLVEYGLDSLPNSAASTGSSDPETIGNRVALTFYRARPDVTYIVESGSAIGSWQVLAVNPGNVGEEVTVTDSVDVGPGTPMRFIRLRITQP